MNSTPEQLAEKETMRIYIGRGYFGGKAVTKKGFVQSIKYYPYHEVKQRLTKRYAEKTNVKGS